MRKTNVLIFPCGAENALVIHSALKYNVNFKVFGASSKSDHGKYVFMNYIGDLPYIYDDKFIEIFNQTLLENKIDIVFPTHDTVSLFLLRTENRLKPKLLFRKKKQQEYVGIKA